MVRRTFWGSLCIFLILAVLIFPANGEDDPFQRLKIQMMRDKKIAPEFILTGLNGSQIALKNLKGRVILLSFWATWCGPCKEELPSFEAIHRRFTGNELTVLTVAVDEEGAIPVKKFLSSYNYTFQILTDSKSKVLDLYGVERIPTTFLIDKRGRIVGKALGPRNWKSPEAISLFNRLIAGAEK